MKAKRIVDLSHTIIPGQEEYRLEADTRPTEQWPQFSQYLRLEDHWYVISELHMNTHVGTHIEFPFHHFKDGLDASEYPLDRLIGDAVVVDISAWGHNQMIELEGLKGKCAGLLRCGDIAYFYTGFDRCYRTERQHDRPWFETAAIEWLAEEMQVKVMGVDTSGIEIRNPDGSASHASIKTIGQPNHEVLLGAGAALVEYMANLDAFLNQRFTTFILPVKIKGHSSGKLALSVSSSAISSPRRTGSPSFFDQATRVASDIASPNVGTTIWIAIIPSSP